MGETTMRIFLIAIMALALAGCNKLEPRSISSYDMEVQGTLIFKANVSQTVEATKAAFKQKGWKVLYEGDEMPKKNYSYFSNRAPFNNTNYDRIAWDQSLSSTIAPKHFLTGKTPTSAFSFGTELFFVFFETPNSGSAITITAATSQVFEKDKVESYINEFSAIVNENLE